MKILFVYPPARDASAPPLGIGYLCSILRSKGYEIDVLDLTSKPFSEEELFDEIGKFHKYDCIGISAIITGYSFLKSFVSEVKKKCPRLPIIVGNGIVNACPEILLKNTKVDALVADEGELTLVELLENINIPKNFKDIKGIWYKDEEGNITKTIDRERIKDLDSLPYPAWDMINIPIYMGNAGPFLTHGFKTGWISTVRGCPFRCEFCSRIYGRGVTHRSPDSMIDEILEFRRIYKNTHVAIVDNEFMVNMKMVKGFANALIERKVNMTWEANWRVNFLNEDLFRLMKKSGCFRLGYGIESGSQKILDIMNKNATVEQAKEAIKLTRKVGIKMHTPMMFGYAGESKHTISETVNFMIDMKLENTKFFFTTPYPGTELYKWARKNNRIKEDEETYLSLLGNNAEKFLVNLTDMSDEEYIEQKSRAEEKLRKSLPFKLKVQRYLIKRIYYIVARMRQHGLMWTIRKIISKCLVNKPS